MMSNKKFFKGDKKDKFRTKTKRACYNYDKYGHYIANCPHEHREKRRRRSDKKDKHYKKKSYGEAHIGKEWDSDDESSDSDSDGVATMAIKGSSSSSIKSLFPNLNKGKHTCLMEKESRRKVKSKTSPPKYVSSDNDLGSSDEEDEDEEALLNIMRKNPKARIKGLLSEVRLHDELLDQQEKLLIQEKESNQDLKKLFKLEKEKNEKLDEEHAQSNGTISSLKSSSGVLQDSYDVLQKTHKDLEVQFDALLSSTSKLSNNNEASTSQVSMVTCDEAIAQENDQLKLEFKKLEKMVSELVKQAKVRPSQDNRRNMVNKPKKGSNITKQASQQSNKAQPLKKQQKTIEEEKLEYASSASLNARSLTSRMTLTTRWEISTTQG
jgi:hypothetical protein